MQEKSARHFGPRCVFYALNPERLNWDAIREKTQEAERINGTDPGMPLEEFFRETEALIREAI